MTAEKKAIDVLVEIQSELKAPKGQYNKFGGYAYRSCEDILEAVKPLLKKAGAALTISDSVDLCGDRVYVGAIVRFHFGGEVIETHAFAREPLEKKGMDASQITGAASSYARKYALNGMFCIDDTKDADATNTCDVQKKQTAPAPVAKPAQPAKKEPTLKDRFDRCKSYFAKAHDGSILIDAPANEKLIQGANEIISELKQAGRANEAADLEKLINSKLKKGE